MEKKRLVRISKFLSLVLRHKPDKIGIKIDKQGWTCVRALLKRSAANGLSFTLDELKEVVAENDKQRFAFSDDELLIRANQGHSIDVELGLEQQVPPDILYHGTVNKFIPSIRKQGLLPQRRLHVHLSPDQETAQKVGERRGWPVILEVLAGKMYEQGKVFYLSVNGVWLTEAVPLEFLRFTDKSKTLTDQEAKD